MSWTYVFNHTNKALGAALAQDRLYGLHILQIQKTNPDISCARLLLIALLDSYKPQHRANWITVHHKMIPIIILINQKKKFIKCFISTTFQTACLLCTVTCSGPNIPLRCAAGSNQNAHCISCNACGSWPETGFDCVIMDEISMLARSCTPCNAAGPTVAVCTENCCVQCPLYWRLSGEYVIYGCSIINALGWVLRTLEVNVFLHRRCAPIFCGFDSILCIWARVACDKQILFSFWNLRFIQGFGFILVQTISVFDFFISFASGVL